MNNILGCFVSSTADSEWDENRRNLAFEKGRLFRTYLWGENGIVQKLEKLNSENYGKDLTMVLFQFYVNPITELSEKLEEIESYRKKEKSIGIPIIVNDDNFFNASEEERSNFLKSSILGKIEILKDVIEKRKLDTSIELLKIDLKELLEN